MRIGNFELTEPRVNEFVLTMNGVELIRTGSISRATDMMIRVEQTFEDLDVERFNGKVNGFDEETHWKRLNPSYVPARWVESIDEVHRDLMI